MSHYYSEKQNTKSKVFEINIRVLGTEFQMFSTDGIFSKDELDSGTKVLIENAIVDSTDFVLDIGCGYGAVGITISKIYGAKVLMTDVNERAVSMAFMNIRKYRLSNIESRKSDVYKNIPESFDVILSNPPQSAGKSVCFEIIEGAFNHLNENGSLQLVARPNKGGRTYEEKMKEVFGNVEKIGKGSGFSVYISRKISELKNE